MGSEYLWAKTVLILHRLPVPRQTKGGYETSQESSMLSEAVCCVLDDSTPMEAI